MTDYSKLFKRAQALVLVAAIMLSVLNVALWPSLFAVEAEQGTVITTTDGEIVAENYELTEQEKEMLKSGYLVSDVYTLTAPGNNSGLIAVDTDNKTVTVKTYKSGDYTWTPVSATIVVGSEVKETITLVKDGDYTGTYTFDGNAFSVKVNYEVTVEIDEDTQTLLLGAATNLSQGVANLDAIANGDATLGLLELAMPSLVILADGIDLGFTEAQLGPESRAAVYALQAQMEANASGKLNLRDVATDYKSVATKTGYLLTKGADAKAELLSTYDYITAVNIPGLASDTLVMAGLNHVAPDKVEAFNALANSIESWYEAVEPAVNDEWAVLDASPLKDGMTDEDYAALDILVNAVVDPVGATLAVKNPLTAATTTLQYNMSMWNVEVKVELLTVDKVVGSTTLISTKSATKTLVFADGTAKSDIEAEAAAFAAGELANWDAYVADKFDVTYSTLSDTLTEDTAYTITYSPKNYDITLSYADTMTVPYGYQYKLPVATEDGADYDYYVDGVYYAEGSIIVVEGPLSITQTLGKAYTTDVTNNIVADCFFADNEKASAILTSGALTVGNEDVAVRYPDANDGLVTISGNTLTAKTYPASYNNLTWKPYTYTVVDGDNQTVYSFGDAETVTITEASYDRVDVVYQLVLDTDALDLVNLPDVLADDAAAQKKALDSLSTDNVLGNMSLLNGTLLAGLSAMINATKLNEDPVKDAELKTLYSSIVADITNNCIDANSGNLKLYDMLLVYADDNNGGLSYYYQNSEAFLTEIDTLSTALSKMVAGEDEKGALAALLGVAGQGDKVEKIESLEGAMASVKANLTAPNEAIDVNSANLDKLVDALLMDGTTTSYTELPAPFALESAAISLTADTKTTIAGVTVKIDGGKTVNVPPKTYNKGHVMTEADIQAWIDAIDTAIATLGVSDDYYTNNYDSSAIKALAGKTVEEAQATLSSLSVVYKAKTFTVHIDGTADQTVSIDSLTVQLPASPDTVYRYDYIINGEVYTGKYTFTKEQLLTLFVDGEYTVKMVKVNVAREQLIALVDSLNADAGAVVFALVENGDEYAIVMKVNAAETSALMGSVQSVAMGFVNSGYMVDLDNKAMIYIDENGELKVSLQAVVDAVMNSGFGTDTLLSVMDANGKINNMTLAGNVISAYNVGALGGKLIATSMQLTKGSTAYDLPFYITLGNAPSALLTARNALAGRAGNYVDVTCQNGSANVVLTLPGKAYEAYLAVLLATDNIDLSDIDAVNAKIAIGFVKDMIDPLLLGDVTTTTVENTLAKLGYDLDVTAYEAYYQYFCDFYAACGFEYDEDSLTATGTLDISKLIDKMNLGTLGTMIAEYESGIALKADFALTNLASDYEAIYVDVKASGVTNKAGLTTDLAKKLPTMAGTALVVLTDNVTGNLTFNTTTVLNLNGFTVTGDIVANGSLTIIDTAADKDTCGGVDGKLSGNVTVLAGRYTDDVSAYLENGYAVTDGVVDNIFYDIVKDGDEITVEINAGLLTIDSIPGVRQLAIDLLADLAFNGYTANSLYVDGYKVYDITVDDLLAIYAGTDRVDTAVNKLVEMFDVAQLDDVINAIVAAFTNFDYIETSIPAGTPIYTAALTVGAWALEVEHVTDGDYLTANLASANTKAMTLNVVVGGSEEDKAALAALAGELADITNELTVKVEMSQALVDKNFVLDIAGTAVVDIDLSAPKYTVMIAILAADAIGGETADALVAGIEYYYASGNMKPLMDAVKALTTAQVISTVKAVGMDDDFTAMIESLGLTDTVSDKVVELQSAYDSVIKLGAALLRRTSITGGSTTIGNYFKTNGTLTGDKENIEKAISRTLKGYTLTLNAEATTIALKVKLFGEEVPEIETPVIESPTVSESDKINKVVVDADGQYIYLDVNKNGITLDELKAILSFEYDAEHFDIQYSITEGLVVNGTVVEAVATNGYGEYTSIAAVSYTIIILGDVNADGMNTAEDVTGITDYLLYYSLSGADEIAADINMDGSIDIRDAYLATKKDADDGENA